MNLEQIIARLNEIRAMLDSGKVTDIDALKKEIDELEVRKQVLEALETRTAAAQALQAGTAMPGSILKPDFGAKTEEKRFLPDSEEYRTAWDKYMLGMPLTAEERTAFTHTTGTTSGQTAGYLVPTTLLNEIWDLMEEEHSILADIRTYVTGAVIEVPLRTGITAGDAGTVAEGVAPADDENNTFAKVTLSGKDFAKTVDISYALGIMSIPAFEQWIKDELADRMGSALARDIVAQILNDYDSTHNDLDVATSGEVVWTDVTNALAALKNTKGQIVFYGNQTTIYKYIVGMVDTTGRPIFQGDANESINGFLAGFPVKKEDAIADDIILVGSPKRIVGNMIQDVMVESAKDIEKHKIIYSGYARFQCALAAPKAFAKLDVTP